MQDNESFNLKSVNNNNNLAFEAQIAMDCVLKHFDKSTATPNELILLSAIEELSCLCNKFLFSQVSKIDDLKQRY